MLITETIANKEPTLCLSIFIQIAKVFPKNVLSIDL